MPKPRVAVVSPFIDKRHGTERSVAECVQRLASDYEIHVYSERLEDLDPETISWHRIPRLSGPHLVSYLWWFAANHIWRWRDRMFLGIVPEIVFSPGVNCLDADVIQVHVVFARLREHMRQQLALGGHPPGAWPRILHRRIYYALIAFLERQIYPQRDVQMVAVSKKTAGDLAHFYSARNVQVAHHGIDLGRFQPALRSAQRVNARRSLNLLPNDFAILLIGNDWKSKGLSCLLNAAGTLRDPSVKLLVVGRDDAAPFEESIRRNGLSNQVQFLPLRPDVEFYFAAADVYASPTLEDSFGLPPAEAMACGVPAITSRLAGVSEIITNGTDGFVLEDASDSSALARILMRLKNDPEMRERIAEAAIATASKLTWDDAAEQLRAAWETARAQKKAAHQP